MKQYECPELNVYLMEVEDVITTSSNPNISGGTPPEEG